MRQTLNCKPGDFDSWLTDTADKPPKTNVLRSTLSGRPQVFARSRVESSGLEGPFSPEPPTSSMLGYTRKQGGYTVGESKSWHTLYSPRV